MDILLISLPRHSPANLLVRATETNRIDDTFREIHRALSALLKGEARHFYRCLFCPIAYRDVTCHDPAAIVRHSIKSIILFLIARDIIVSREFQPSFGALLRVGRSGRQSCSKGA